MRAKTRHNSIQVFALIIAAFMALAFSAIASAHDVKGADLSSASIVCTGSTNIGNSTAVVQTGGPINATFGHVFDVRASVFNRTSHCHKFEAMIVIGGGAWEFPNATGPRITTGTRFTLTEPTPGYYYTYTMHWTGWIKPNSHVNFYEPMEVATGAPKGMTQIIEIYLGDPNKANTPKSAWAIKIQ